MLAFGRWDWVSQYYCDRCRVWICDEDGAESTEVERSPLRRLSGYEHLCPSCYDALLGQPTRSRRPAPRTRREARAMVERRKSNAKRVTGERYGTTWLKYR